MANPSYRRTLRLIGQVCKTWNDIESLWYLIYTCLVHELPRDKANDVYWSHLTFAHQRALILSLAGSCFPDVRSRPHVLRKQIGQLNARTEELAGKRNAIIHADYRYEIADETRPMQTIDVRIAPGARQRKPNRFASTDLPAEALLLVNENCVHERELENYRRRLFREFLPADKRPSKEESEPLPPITIRPG